MKLFQRASHVLPAIFCLIVLALFVLTTSTAVAAPPRPARTLTFHVTARFDARRAGESMGQPQQTLAAKVYSKGNRLRVETRLSDQPVVFLYSPPYVYKLLPNARAGVRYRVPSGQSRGSSQSPTFDLQNFLRNPALIRGALQRHGARRIKAGTINGSTADLYAAQNFMGKGQTVNVWLRRGDAMPLRLEARSRTLSGVVSWRNYRRDAPLPNTLFASPSGYNIRDSRDQPRLM